MSDRAPTLWPLAAIEHPRCILCHARMNVVCREPHRDDAEKRTFECQKCSFIMTQIVADPLGSADRPALSRSLKPPA